MQTKRAVIVSALRGLWMRSNERTECLKRQSYTCQRCGAKKSQAKGREVKVEVHHKKGVLNWEELVTEIRRFLLCDVEDLECLCKVCHDKER